MVEWLTTLTFSLEFFPFYQFADKVLCELFADNLLSNRLAELNYMPISSALLSNAVKINVKYVFFF